MIDIKNIRVEAPLIAAIEPRPLKVGKARFKTFVAGGINECEVLAIDGKYAWTKYPTGALDTRRCDELENIGDAP